MLARGRGHGWHGRRSYRFAPGRLVCSRLPFLVAEGWAHERQGVVCQCARGGGTRAVRRFLAFPHMYLSQRLDSSRGPFCKWWSFSLSLTEVSADVWGHVRTWQLLNGQTTRDARQLAHCVFPCRVGPRGCGPTASEHSWVMTIWWLHHFPNVWIWCRRDKIGLPKSVPLSFFMTFRINEQVFSKETANKIFS